MKYSVSLLGRSLILGGGFGASIGQFLGQFTENRWELIGVMTLVGIAISLVCVLGIYSVQPWSKHEFETNDSAVKLAKNGGFQRNKAA